MKYAYLKSLQRVFLVILIGFLSVNLLFGLGEKPKKGSAETEETAKPKVEATADAQFKKAYQEYLQAKRMNFTKANQQAIQSFQDYLQYYPKDSKRIDAIFYIEKLAKQDLDIKDHQKYLAQYFEEAPTTNYFYKYAQIDQLSLYIDKKNTVSANALLAVLEKDLAQADNFYKKELYQTTLKYYEMQQNFPKLIEIYTFLTASPDNSESKPNYYMNCYNFGLLYYTQEKWEPAKKYFSIVANAKDFDTTYMIKFAKEYITKIDKKISENKALKKK